MKRYIEGVSRDQGTLFPDYFDDWIDDENGVPVIDAFVEELDPRTKTTWRNGIRKGRPIDTRHPVVPSISESIELGDQGRE